MNSAMFLTLPLMAFILNLAGTNGVALKSRVKRMAGGRRVNLAAFSGFVQLRSRYPGNTFGCTQSSYVCAGTLISRQWVLTAAHCFNVCGGPSMAAPYWSVRFGLGTSGSEQNVDVERVVVHHKFSQLGRSRLMNDIALVKLRHPVSITTGSTVKIPAYPLTHYRRQCLSLGWHEGNPEQPAQMDLLRCGTRGKSICAYTSAGKSLCEGDSGGPLLCYKQGRWWQVGVLSSGNTHACAGRSRRQSVYRYTRIVSFKHWIRSVLIGRYR